MYPEEKILGNQFTVTCTVGISNEAVTEIEETVDYAILMEIIQKHFATPTPLLETLAQKIEAETKQRFPQILYFILSIRKKSVMLNAQLDSSEIILEKNY
ncbi:MAG: dihydroneopterin aldolase [Bacteroidetes bacterium]|nr:dihydroneopterin aldolase [Bacteroidota bacterium]